MAERLSAELKLSEAPVVCKGLFARGMVQRMTETEDPVKTFSIALSGLLHFDTVKDLNERADILEECLEAVAAIQKRQSDLLVFGTPTLEIITRTPDGGQEDGWAGVEWG